MIIDRKLNVFSHKCQDCGVEQLLKYSTYWHRTKKGKNKCHKCSVKGGNLFSFKIGRVPWNSGLNISGMSGKKQSDKQKLKRSEMNRLFPVSNIPGVREKMRLAKLGKVGNCLGKTWKVSSEKLINFGKCKGAKHHNWKGGITPENKIERTKFKNNLRVQVLKRDSFSCQICGSKNCSLHVDHIKSWSKNKDLRFDITNCRTLCSSCHYEVTFRKKMPSHVKNWGLNKKKAMV